MAVKDLILRMRDRLVGALGSVGMLGVVLTSELVYNHVDGTIYAGKGNDGTGKATSIVAVAGDVKADKSFVDGQLALKANQQYVVDGLNSKADLALTQTIFAQLGSTIADEVARATAKDTQLTTDLAGALAVAQAKQSPATSLAGYGITDGMTEAQTDARILFAINVAPDALITVGKLATALTAAEAGDATVEQNIIALITQEAQTSRAEATALGLAATAADTKATDALATLRTEAQVQAAIEAHFASFTVIYGGSI